MRYQPQWYRSPIDLPEARSGKVEVKHRIVEVGDTVPIVGMRQAVTRGVRPASGKVKERLKVHELRDSDHGVWMTDMPEELNQIGEMLHDVNPQGRVLVGGLGLGILAATLAQREGVYHVTVVEKDPDVVKLCQRPGYDVVTADIHDYLEKSDQEFDFYLLDTWQSTNEMTWWGEVVPMRRAIRQRFGVRPVIHCWAEDIMIGQIFQSLTTKPPHWYYENLPMPMSAKAARSFIKDVGKQKWERDYGRIVDNTFKQMEVRRAS